MNPTHLTQHVTVCNDCAQLNKRLWAACEQVNIHVMAGHGRDSRCDICKRERGGAVLRLRCRDVAHLRALHVLRTL